MKEAIWVEGVYIKFWRDEMMCFLFTSLGLPEIGHIIIKHLSLIMSLFFFSLWLDFIYKSLPNLYTYYDTHKLKPSKSSYIYT